MKRSKVLCVLFPFVMALCTACSGSGADNLSIESEPVEVEEDDTSAGASEVSTDDSANASSSEDVADVNLLDDDKEFSCVKLKDNESTEVDLGKDGKPDTLFLECTNDSLYFLKVNDKKVDLITENPGFEFGPDTADVFYAHRTNGDFVFVSRTTATNGGAGVTLYEIKDGSMTKVDEIPNAELSFFYDEDDGMYETGMSSSIATVIRTENVLCWMNFVAPFSYGSNGFKMEEKLYGISMGREGEMVLKKPLDFCDESGKVIKTVEAGKVVSPWAGNDPYEDPDNVQTTGNKMQFVDENGEQLGFITYEMKKNNGIYDVYIDGVNSEEIFEINEVGDI